MIAAAVMPGAVDLVQLLSQLACCANGKFSQMFFGFDAN